MIPLEEFWLMIEKSLENYKTFILSDIVNAYRAGAEAAYNIIEASLTDDGK
jgi:hypothetical protein